MENGKKIYLKCNISSLLDNPKVYVRYLFRTLLILFFVILPIQLFVRSHKGPFGRIIIYARSKCGSTDVRGLQICDELRKKGYNARTCVGKIDINIKKSDLVIFLKCFPINKIIPIKHKGCRVVYDIIDAYNPFLLFAESKFFDAIIFPNKKMLQDLNFLKRKKIIFKVINHHIDPRFSKKIPSKREFAIGYFGIGKERNAIFHNYFKELKLYEKFNDFPVYGPKIPFHYSMRNPNTREFMYKPSTKVGTAAACGSALITSREPTPIDLLGNDYPYFVDFDCNEVKKIINFARKTYKKEAWKKAMKKMKKVKRELDIKNIIKEYISLFDDITNIHIKK